MFFQFYLQLSILQYYYATEIPYSWNQHLLYDLDPYSRNFTLDKLKPLQPYYIFLRGYIEEHTTIVSGQQPKTFYSYTKLSRPVACTSQGCKLHTLAWNCITILIKINQRIKLFHPIFFKNHIFVSKFNRNLLLFELTPFIKWIISQYFSTSQ